MLNNKIGLELVGWVLTAVMAVLALLPIYSQAGMDYPFYFQNLLIIVIAITFCRYIFLLKYHWLSSRKWIKVLFVFIPIPVAFFLVGAFYDFQAFSDEKGIASILTEMHFDDQAKLAKYIRAQMILFWSAAFLANAFMPIRMIVSIYREINKGTH